MSAYPRFTILKRIVVLFAQESGEIRPAGSTLGVRPAGSTLGVRPQEVPLGCARSSPLGGCTGQVILQPILPKSDRHLGTRRPGFDRITHFCPAVLGRMHRHAGVPQERLRTASRLEMACWQCGRRLSAVGKHGASCMLNAWRSRIACPPRSRPTVETTGR
jgi:hypothetical protein